MPQIAVGSTVVPISNPATSPGINGINAGTQPIYCGPDPTVNSASASQTLAEGDVLNWPAGQPLYVVCAPGQVSIFQYSNNGATITKGSLTVIGTVTATLEPGTQVDATITNASVPVTGNVNATIENASIPVTGNVNATIEPGATVDAHITNASIPVTGNVNATIENASIPVTGTVDANITNANIALAPGTTVDINSGTVNVGNTPNVTPLFQQSVLHAGPGVIPPVNVANIDVSSFQSIAIVITPDVAVAIDPTRMLSIELRWNSPDYSLHEIFYGLDASKTTIIRKLKAPNLEVIVLSVGSGAARSIDVTVFGMTQDVDEIYSHNTSAAAQPAGSLSGSDDQSTMFGINQIPGSALLSYYPSHVAEESNINWNIATGTSPALQLYAVADLDHWQINVPIWVSNSAGQGSQLVQLPNRPLMLQARSSANMQFALAHPTSIL